MDGGEDLPYGAWLRTMTLENRGSHRSRRYDNFSGRLDANPKGKGKMNDGPNKSNKGGVPSVGSQNPVDVSKQPKSKGNGKLVIRPIKPKINSGTTLTKCLDDLGLPGRVLRKGDGDDDGIKVTVVSSG
ncbi:hypothetical protein QYF36_023643 [Acer negundo]|nr:hypothetical protein QYF36_023643 [Acer negundo]